MATQAMNYSTRERTTATPARSLLTIKQAADYLGMTESAIRCWVWKRQIPYLKIGRAVRIEPATLDSIISRGLVPAAER